MNFLTIFILVVGAVFSFFFGEDSTIALHTHIKFSNRYTLFTDFIMIIYTFLAIGYCTSMNMLYVTLLAIVMVLSAIGGYFAGYYTAYSINKFTDQYCHLKKHTLISGGSHEDIEIDLDKIFGDEE